MIFTPSLIGRDRDGVVRLVYDAIQRCDVDTRKILYQNIVLAGGTTMIENFAARMKKDISVQILPQF